MATVALGQKAVGSVVKLKFNGAMREFLVVHQGRPSTLYDASCDGTWLLMKDCLEAKRWHSSDVNDYANSEVNGYLNSTVLSKFDADIQAQIKQVKIPYRPGSGTSGTVNSGANGLSVKIFLLSDREVGYTTSTFVTMAQSWPISRTETEPARRSASSTAAPCFGGCALRT